MGIAFALGAAFFAIWAVLVQIGATIIKRARGWYRVPAWIVAAVLIWGPLMLL